MTPTHTVLLVEDNPITRRLARFALESNAFRVVEAFDGAAALDAFAKEDIALVLQDLCLPDIDGYELVGRLRALPRGTEVPIIAFSGLISADDEGRLSAAGFDDHVSKPMEPARLAQIVRAHLPAPDDSAKPAMFGTGRRIIVADDDAVQRKLAAFRLEKLGFEVTSVDDGAHALAEARRAAPDAVLSDVLMPGLDGFGLVTELRRDPSLSRVPLVLTTNSYVEPADKELALKAGAHGLVHRTPDLKEVIEVLSHALEHGREAAPSASPAELEQEHTRRMMRQLERQVTLNARVTQRAALLSAEIAVLKGISEALASQTSVDEAVHQALSACFDASGVSLGALFLRDNGHRRVVPFGFAKAEGEAVLKDFWGEPQLLDQVMESQSTLVLGRDAEAEGKRVMARAGVASALLVPVRHDRVGSGALLMMSRNGALESEDRIAFAEAVAGQISQALAVAHAFMQRERSERVAREQAAMLRSMLGSIGDAVLVADESGKFVQWNKAGQGMVDMATRAGEFKEGAAILRPDRVTPMPFDQLPLVRAMRGQSFDGVEVFIRQPGQSEGAPFSATGRPWRDESGKLLGGVVVLRDITHEKQTQSQLMVSDRLASMGMLAAGVAHEINNPLSAVVANLALMRAHFALPEGPGRAGAQEHSGVRSLIDDANEAADRVRSIVGDLKLFSRHDEEAVGAVDIRRVLDSSARMAWNEVRHRAQLIKEYDGPPMVRGVESRLGQVFLNLLMNAVQAIPEGNAAGNAITIRTKRHANGLAIEVVDTGAGMTAETQRNLFTPFFTTKPVGVGTGLGLTICQRIITTYGGEIQVESVLGKGTTFRVVLPLEKIPGTKPGEPNAGPGAAMRSRMLVVDDEELVGRMIRRILMAHHEVVVVRSVDEAVQVLGRGETFELILSDLMMPQKTGIDLFNAVSDRFPGVERRIVFMTGGAFTPAARTFLDSVANPRVTKPFMPDELTRAVSEALEGLKKRGG
ncbi:MAG: response regulator [Archangium sp.]|nr:response regulator [Archangium sp.]